MIDLSAITPLAPALLMLVASPLLLLLPRGAVRNFYMLALPLMGLILLWSIPNATAGQVEIFSHQLTLVRLDDLSRIFATMFFIGAFFAILFAWRSLDRLEQISASWYAGAAIAAALAGDLITFFIFWELTSLSSVLLVMAARTASAYRAAFRYLMMQMISGLLLLSGIIFYLPSDILFNAINPTETAGLLILAAFAVKAAFPLLHYWLADTYPEATPTGTVFLSIFTTKLAIYALLRGFAGFEPLIYIGVVMALYPALYAMIENDLRRVLSHSLNSQLGFMVAAIGIGSGLALNGAVAHAFGSVLYQALLFMAVGAVIMRTGHAKADRLGGLYRSMPMTLWLCLIGVASIIGLPLLVGFTSKSLSLSAILKADHLFIWFGLLAANAAAFYHSGFRLSYGVFFGKDRGLQTSEAPKHMLIAMAGLAALCVLLGFFPQVLYRYLPYQMDYWPYDYSHVITQMELIIFAALASVLLAMLGFASRDKTNIDLDWIARAFPYHLRNEYQEIFVQTRRWFLLLRQSLSLLVFNRLHAIFSHQDRLLATEHPTGFMALWIAILLSFIIVLAYIQ